VIACLADARPGIHSITEAESPSPQSDQSGANELLATGSGLSASQVAEPNTQELTNLAEAYVSPSLLGAGLQEAIVPVSICALGFPTVSGLAESLPLILSSADETDGLVVQCSVGADGYFAEIVFGAPTPASRAEKRAADYALLLRDQLGGSVRLSLSCGRARAAVRGTAHQSFYSIEGHVALRARKLLTAAAPGQILLGPQAESVLESSYAVQPAARVALPGSKRGVQTSTLLWRERSFSPEAGVFVGRTEESRLLADYLQTLDPSVPETVLIVGPPGIGKSTLVMRHLGGLPSTAVLTVIGSDRPQPAFDCLTEAIRNYWDLPAREDPRFRDYLSERFESTRLRSASEELEEELDRLRPYFEYTFGIETAPVVGLSPEVRHAGAVEAWRTVLRALAPVRVAWVDDFQWLDEATREVLHIWLGDETSAGPRLLVCSRPIEAGEEEAATLGRTARKISLSPLSHEEVRELLRERGADQMAGKDEIELIAQRSEGNPFYLEQCIRYLQETGGAKKDAVPENAHAIILARVGHLSESVRHAVRSASILGLKFDMRILSAMLRDEQVPEATQPAADDGIWEAASELNYIFRHALIRDTVYESQLESQRTELHAAAAKAYETVFSGISRRAHLYEIADHYERAGIIDKSRDYLKLAADYAVETYDRRRAIDLLRRRLSLAGDDDLRARVDLAEGLVGAGAWEEALDLLEKTIARFESAAEDFDLPQTQAAIDCYHEYAELLIDRGDAAKGDHIARRGLSYADDLCYAYGLAMLWRSIGLAAYARESYTEALAAYARGNEFAQISGDERAVAKLLNNTAVVYSQIGQYEEALAAFKSNLALSRKTNDFNGTSAALNNIGFLYDNMGRPEEALPYFEEDLEMCRRSGDRQGQSVALGNVASVLATLGRNEEALPRFYETLAIDERIGFLPHKSYYHKELGENLRGLGREQEACEELRRAFELADRIDFPMVRESARELLNACPDYQPERRAPSFDK
jgi:tetratricopeptide (TPR) repeat protein